MKSYYPFPCLFLSFSLFSYGSYGGYICWWRWDYINRKNQLIVASVDSGEPKILISVPAMLVVALLKDVPHSIDLHDVVDVIMILLILLEFEYHIPEDRLVFTLLLSIWNCRCLVG